MKHSILILKKYIPQSKLHTEKLSKNHIHQLKLHFEYTYQAQNFKKKSLHNIPSFP